MTEMSETSSHISLMALVERSQNLSEEAFVKELGGWVLVGPPVEIEADDWNYRTLSARSVRDRTEAGEVFVLRDSYAAYPLRKSRPGPFADTVLIGRSSSNDCLIAHTSISKLHARVRMDPLRNVPQISDAGSSNGTQVNEKRVPEGQWQAMEVGDVATIGSCSFRVVSPERLYQLVSRLQR